MSRPEASDIGRQPMGVLPGMAMLAAPVLVASGMDAGRWYAVALGWLGTLLLAAAAFTAHRLRSSFTDEIAEVRSFAVALGDTGCRMLYAGLVVASYVVLAGLTVLVPWTGIAMLSAVLLVIPVWQVWSGAVDRLLDPVVRDTALVCLYYGGLVGFGLYLG